MTPRYPHVHVQLTGRDRNAFGIIGRVRTALKQAGVPADEFDAFSNQAMDSPSYDAVLQFVMSTVEVS